MSKIAARSSKKRKRNQEEKFEASEEDLRPENVICESCQALDIEAAFQHFNTIQENGDFSSISGGVWIADVGTRLRQLIPSDECALCGILSRTRLMTPGTNGGELNINRFDELRAFSFLHNFSGLQKNTLFLPGSKDDALFLAVVPSEFKSAELPVLRAKVHKSGYPVCYRRGDLTRGACPVQDVKQQFYARLVTKWIDTCRDNHTRVCLQGSTKEVEGLKLIDCNSLKVVPARDGDKYVALSYVWGSSWSLESYAYEFSNEAVTLPSHLPAVVKDAIRVAKLLHLRYLWVDKYCINQFDDEEKYHQIRAMDSIYMNAELTIVAAAGIDESHGLPGVGDRKRKMQPVANIGEFRIVSTMRHPHASIRESKWASRGWTFQEAFLAKRRLVFTDEQMYYECEGMNCYESISTPLKELHLKDHSRFREFVRAGVFGRNERHAFGKFDTQKLPFELNILQYWNAIQEFSSRELRFDKDAFDAFAGICHSFLKRANPVAQYWGIAFPSRPEQPEQGVYSTDARDYFADALGWAHTRQCWDEEQRPRRRPEFPSWSWVGWRGEVKYHHREDIVRNPKLYLPEAGFLRLECGQDLDVEIQTLINITNEGKSKVSIPRRLRFVAYLLDPNAISFNAETCIFSIHGIPARLSMSVGPATEAEVYNELCKGELLKCTYLSFWKGTVKILILKSVGQTYIRAGLFSIAGGMSFNKQAKKLWHKTRVESARKSFVVE